MAATRETWSKLSWASAIVLFVLLIATSKVGEAKQFGSTGSLTVTPSTVVLTIDGTAELSVIDSSGRPVSDAQWSVSPSIAEIEVENGAVRLRATESGRAVLTAFAENLSAAATVTIVASEQLSATTVQWSLTPTPGYEPLLLRQAEPGDQKAAMYDIEWNASAPAIVRALRPDGEQVWMTRLSSLAGPSRLGQEVSPPQGRTLLHGQPVDNVGQLLLGEGGTFFAIMNPKAGKDPAIPPEGQSFLVRVVGDSSGGLILVERGHSNDSIVDISAKDGSEAWRYNSVGRFGKDLTVTFNNQIGIVETEADIPSSSLIVLDGQTGKLLYRNPFPTSSTTVKGLKCIAGNDIINLRPSRAGSIFSSADGNIYVQVEIHNEMGNAAHCGSDNYVFDNSLSMLRVTPRGEAAWKSFADVHSEGNSLYVAQPRVFAGESIPDGMGGELAAWTYFFPGGKDGQKPHYEARLTRIPSDFSDQLDYTLPMPGWEANPLKTFEENMVLGEQDTLYAVGPRSLISFDIAEGEVNWVRRPPTGEVEIQWSTAGGGILVANAGTLGLFDHAGNGVQLPWTPKPSGSFADARDIDLAQFNLFDRTPLPPLALRSVQVSWTGDWLGVEEGPPFGQGSIFQFVAR